MPGVPGEARLTWEGSLRRDDGSTITEAGVVTRADGSLWTESWYIEFIRPDGGVDGRDGPPDAEVEAQWAHFAAETWLEHRRAGIDATLAEVLTDEDAQEGDPDAWEDAVRGYQMLTRAYAVEDPAQRRLAIHLAETWTASVNDYLSALPALLEQ